MFATEQQVHFLLESTALCVSSEKVRQSEVITVPRMDEQECLPNRGLPVRIELACLDIILVLGQACDRKRDARQLQSGVREMRNEER